jgi:hypothetical protein
MKKKVRWLTKSKVYEHTADSNNESEIDIHCAGRGKS